MMGTIIQRFKNHFRDSQEPDAHNRILITGIGKSGTTAVYYAILNSLPPKTLCLFEPQHANKTLPENIKPPVLVKTFIPYSDHFSFFEKKILLVRDARDQLLSAMIYKPYNIVNRARPGEKAEAKKLIDDFIALLKRKESNPELVTVCDLLKVVKIHSQGNIRRIIDYYQTTSDLFVLKYEDFVDKKLDDLEEYLQLKITWTDEVPREHKRVVRTKSHGGWRDWYTESDVEHFKPVFQDYLDLFGYGDDWQLNENPHIDPGTSSKYVEKIIKSFRGT
jgi:hypothetical protein